MAKFILDGQEYGGGSGSNVVKLTQSEYDALPNDKLSDDNIYLITDSGELTAENLFYDDTETGLGVNNVQDAIVKQNKNFNSDMKIDSEISITSGYTTPCDGYCSVAVYSGGSGFYTLKLDSFSVGLWESGASTQLHSIFVKKGMTITFTDNTGKSAETTFKPIKYK